MSASGRQLSVIDVARACAIPADADRLRDIVRMLSVGPERVSAWRMVRDGGLAPLLATALGPAGLADADPRVAAALRSALEVNALRNAMLRRAAVEATKALNAVGITPLWFKGVWLASHIYPQPAMRTMHDIDLLVPEGAVSLAGKALGAIGYSAATPADARGAAGWNHTFSRLQDLPGGTGSLEIDLHDRLRLSAAVVWSADHLRARASELRAAGAHFRVPDPEAGLLYGALHLFKHGFDLRHALTAVCDSAALLARRGEGLDLDWLSSRLSDPLQATALYMLLTLTGRQPTDAGEELLRRSRDQVDRQGARGRADAVVRSVGRLPLMTRDDFSLFDFGESGPGWAALTTLAYGTLRWRRRVMDGSGATTQPSVARLLRRANWRYAYTSYMAGRLSARLRSAIPS